ncbi:hypothetical protein C0992_009742 [Termitomyces sp. T32_za158]|nr:hypothetical protein C0992_009742 [Termitomyces sp. T32_za158]
MPRYITSRPYSVWSECLGLWELAQTSHRFVESLICEPYNTFDGPGFPACNNVIQVFRPSSVEEMQTIVKDAVMQGQSVRASGVCLL